MRKTNFKLDLLSFNIFGSSEYEKNGYFLKQLNFVLLTKDFQHITKSIKTICSLIF